MLLQIYVSESYIPYCMGNYCNGFGIVYGVKEHSTGVILMLLVLAFLPRFIRWLFYCFLEAVGDYGLQRKGLTRKCRRMRFKSYMDQEINKEIENL